MDQKGSRNPKEKSVPARLPDPEAWDAFFTLSDCLREAFAVEGSNGTKNEHPRRGCDTDAWGRGGLHSVPLRDLGSYERTSAKREAVF